MEEARKPSSFMTKIIRNPQQASMEWHSIMVIKTKKGRRMKRTWIKRRWSTNLTLEKTNEKKKGKWVGRENRSQSCHRERNEKGRLKPTSCFRVWQRQMKRDKSLFVSAQTVRIKPVPVSMRPEAEEKTGAEGDSSSALGTPTPRFYLFVTSRISNFNANAATHLYSMELLATQMLRRLCRINFLTLFPPPIPHQLHFGFPSLSFSLFFSFFLLIILVSLFGCPENVFHQQESNAFFRCHFDFSWPK